MLMAEYPEEFVKAVDDLIDNWEGGYVSDPDDPGGETKFGVSKRSYPDLDIKALTRDEAIAIYYRDFWQKYEIEATVTNPDMRGRVFNMAVLVGPVTALALAKRSANLEQFKAVCVRHFEGVVAMHPQCRKYLAGWIRRANA